MRGSGQALGAVTAVVLLAATAGGALRAAPTGPLELRRIEGDRLARGGVGLPRRAVRVFVYEGAPLAARIGPKHLAIDYGRSGVLFARRTGDLPDTDGGGDEGAPDRLRLGPCVLRVERRYHRG